MCAVAYVVMVFDLRGSVGLSLLPSNRLEHIALFVVHVHDIQDIFIVMELHSGGELFDRIVGRPRFTEDEVRVHDIFVAETVCRHVQRRIASFWWFDPQRFPLFLLF